MAASLERIPSQDSGADVRAVPHAKSVVRTRPLARRLDCASSLLFCLGLVFIPFDNLFFAPSSGWATVAPIIFALYVGLNLGELSSIKFNVKFAAVAAGVMALQLLNVVLYGLHFDSLIDALMTITLGFLFYVALIIRYEGKEGLFDHDAKVLFWAYAAAFAYGIAWFIIWNLFPDLPSFFDLVEKRPYRRLAFSFTEPSFISVHVFGVLMLYSYFVSDRKIAKRLVGLGIAFIVFAVVANSGARVIVDAGVFVLLLLIGLTIRDSKHSVRNLLLWALLIVVVIVAVGSSSRLQAILAGGFSQDGSAATRLFKIQTMVYGFIREPLSALFGFGFGNMIIPLQLGYEDALAGYTNRYTYEVQQLGQMDEVSWIASMPVRLGAEIGILVFLIATVAVFVAAKRKGVDPLVIIMTLWLYVQFDSYAFYGIWMILFLLRDYNPEKMGVSYFELFIPKKKKLLFRGRKPEKHADGRRA